MIARLKSMGENLMTVSQLNDTCRGVMMVLILLITGLFMIWSGWSAFRNPQETKFWTDSTGVWLTKKLKGELAASELDHRLREESRIARSGVVGVVLGILFVIAAVVVFILLYSV